MQVIEMNSKNTVLIVDDDEAHRGMLCMLLKTWGYDVDEADDGDTALSKVREKSFDAVLTDVRMGRVDGITTLREILSYNPSLPVILMTAYSSVQTAVEALRVGAYDYLIKPLDFDALKNTLARAIEHSRLSVENRELRRQLAEVPKNTEILGRSKAINDLRAMISTVAPTDATVLVTGESGTGKELVARALHAGSPRAQKPIVTVNCAALAENLLESELFGHERGAFTGADRRREGRFKQADGGTLFLDEIGEMPIGLQAKLLRALQQGEIQRLGSDRSEHVDVRVIAATNRDLRKEVANHNFREDLYFRLVVITIKTPPLRDHKRDIPYMTVAFLKEGLAKAGEQRDIPDISRGALSKMMHYHWPGNVRELRNCVMRTLAYCDGDIILPHCVDIGAQNEEKGDGNQNRTPTELLQKAWERRQESAGPAQEASGAASVPLPAPSQEPEKRDTTQTDPVSPDSGPCEAARRSPDTKSSSEEIPGTRALNSRMRAALTEILKRESLSRQDYQDIAGKDISMRTAQYDLQELVKAGFLRREGRGPALRYIVIRSEKNAPSGQEDSI